MTTPRATGVPEGMTRLSVRRRMQAAPAAVVQSLEDPPAWLGPEAGDPPAGLRRFQTDLRLRVSEEPSIVTFRKAAYVDLGPVAPTADGWELEVSWRPATLTPLFPVFSGSIVLKGQEATLTGLYASPTLVGRLADLTLLRIAALGTGRWLLATLDQAATESGRRA
jgi:hypothetical protein